jgi:hypothetical protein
MERTLAKQDKMWFRLSHVPAKDGNKGGRIYIIKCARCAVEERFAPHSISDAALRKRMLGNGWELSRRWDQHICPSCNKPKPAVQKEAPTSTQPFIVEAWQAASEAERSEFIRWFVSSGALDQYRPSVRSLLAHWQHSSPEERDRVLAEVVPLLLSRDCKKYLKDIIAALPRLMTEISLLECWNVAPDGSRSTLLRWIESTIAQKRTLVDHWKAATPREREAILAANRPPAPEDLHQPTPVARPPSPSAHHYMPTQALPSGTIRKTDLAKKLGVNPATVSGYLNAGMPQRADGLLDHDAVMAWINDRRSAPARNRQRYANAPPPPQESVIINGLDDDAAVAAWSDRLFPKYDS